MIRVNPKPEPANFDHDVRQPGKAFLRTCSHPTTAQYRNRAYWSKISQQLYEAYGKVCAYCCLWIPAATGVKTVEHFRPKSKYPEDAYEWSNYRLVASKLNGRKGKYEDVIDPFLVINGWFVLDFSTLLIHASAALDPEDSDRVEATISRLKLNDDDTCVEDRLAWLQEYCDATKAGNEAWAFGFLRRRAPFIAIELDRQKLRTTIASHF